MVYRERLAGFLSALSENGILTFDKNRFNHRLKVQKYVYIANCFGFKTYYSYSLYIHGPYSSSLAHDYYAVGEFQNAAPIALNERFVKLVKGKSEEWLELAATIIMIRRRYARINHDDLIDLVITNKPYANREDLRIIIATLERFGCLVTRGNLSQS
jgi:uncharacterized protein YwgA